MLESESYITERLVIDDSWDQESVECFSKALKEAYGLTIDEYLTIRNKLLDEYNNKLPESVLMNAILNKIIIDLAGRGYLKIDIDLNGVKYDLTKKAYLAITKKINHIPENLNEAKEALCYLRNNELLG